MKEVNCISCGRILIKNEIGLSKKLLGEDITDFYCLDCLASLLEVTVEELLDKIEDFKAEGCKLFS